MKTSSSKNCQVSADSIILCKNTPFISDFKQWEHFSEKGENKSSYSEREKCDRYYGIKGIFYTRYHTDF